jgi:hypothetical protein
MAFVMGLTVEEGFGQRVPTAYVATNGTHTSPFTNWATAASNIQAAVDVVAVSGTVWVGDGVYDSGGATVYSMSNRVALTQAVNVCSVNGPDATFIVGSSHYGTNGPTAIRCAYLTNGAVLKGFTLTNGYTLTTGSDVINWRCGGGAWLDQGGTLSNCVLTGNGAAYAGGGVFCFKGGTVVNSAIRGNSSSYGAGAGFWRGGTVLKSMVSGNNASSEGGGAYCDQGGTVENSVISGNNSFSKGGGVACYLGGTVVNSVISSNSSSIGGGTCCYRGTFINTIIYLNVARDYANWANSGSGSSYTNCCSYPMPSSGTGNITNNPLFVNAAAGNYRLKRTSPCIDAGVNQNWMAGATDLDGTPRVAGNGIVDMGAYELLGTTAYAATNGSHTFPYASWATAASNIQAALGAVAVSGTVWVGDGVYDTGGALVYGMSNRVALTQAVTLRSVNGPGATIIVGASHDGTNGPSAIRCVYMTNGAVLAGFTLTNGHTLASGDVSMAQSGGGAWLDHGGIVTNCVFSGNGASSSGGGIYFSYGGTLLNSTLSANSADSGGGAYCSQGGSMANCILSANSAVSGGGAYCSQGGSMTNCILSANSADSGGGAYCSQGGIVANCTLSGNGSSSYGGGIYCSGGTLINTILYFNNAPSDPNWYNTGSDASYTNCCAYPLPSPGAGNITNDPHFVSASTGDFRLLPPSPCIDAGMNQNWMTGTTDLDGRPRVIHGTVDMGVYELPLSKTTYVATNGSHQFPYSNWAMAASNIQEAVNAVAISGTVWVGDGAYSTGGETMYGVSTRVALTQAATVRSINGPGATFIVGASHNGSYGPNAIRCVYIRDGAILAGFTLTNGYTHASGDLSKERSGGGAFLDNGGILSNCVFSGNDALERGGGAICYWGGTLQNCTLSGNSAKYGAGVYCVSSGTLQTCVLVNNYASLRGSGVYFDRGGTLQNCTLSRNTALALPGLWGDFKLTAA